MLGSRGTALAALAACALTVALAAGAPGCVIGEREVAVPDGDDAVVLLLTCALSQPMSEIARHGWLAGRKAGESTWQRFEIGGGGSDPLADSGCGGGGDVRLHAIWRGAKAAAAIECLEREDRAFKSDFHYVVWPGPNSNTYADKMLRACNLHADLPSTSVGKDYRGRWIGASWTSGGTGVQIETALVGLKIGLTEGIEVHIMALSIGVDWWPPAIILPLGGGRIGFADW